MGQSSGSGFDEREKSFEIKYFHDEELNFRMNAKRNHLFGLWAATLLGYTEEKADRYIDEVILSDVQRTHEEDVLHKVLKDLQAAHVEMSEHRVRKKLEECAEAARQMVMKDEEFKNG